MLSVALQAWLGEKAICFDQGKSLGKGMAVMETKESPHLLSIDCMQALYMLAYWIFTIILTWSVFMLQMRTLGSENHAFDSEIQDFIMHKVVLPAMFMDKNTYIHF